LRVKAPEFVSRSRKQERGAGGAERGACAAPMMRTESTSGIAARRTIAIVLQADRARAGRVIE
jgi:hypothetical protein